MAKRTVQDMVDAANAKRTLGERIRDERVRLGWSQPYLGMKVGVRATSIWKWETGRAQPKFHHAIKLSELFDIAIAELARHVRPPAPHPGLNKARPKAERETPFASGE